MHIVMLSDSETSGGASIAAARLAEALIASDCKVTRIVFYPDDEKHSWDTKVLRLHYREHDVLRPLKSVPFNLAVSVRIHMVSKRLDHLLTRLSPDVINIHNLHGAEWSHSLLEACARHAPTLWTLHDTWSFTGHCAYHYDCDKFIKGCDSTCPRPEEYPPMPARRIASSWNRRRSVLARHPEIVAVAPSKWMAMEAVRGMWKGHRVEVISNSLPLDLYKPMDRKVARDALGIEGKAPVLISAAENLNDKRKGGKLLIEALKKVSTRPITLVTFGRGHLTLNEAGVNVHQLGFINPEQVKVLAYNTADIMVHPAVLDNLPNTIMESIACGVPVIGFPAGGIAEMVRPGLTGWLAGGVSPGELATAIDTALDDLKKGKSLADKCRSVALSEYDPGIQAKKYMALFKSINNL